MILKKLLWPNCIIMILRIIVKICRFLLCAITFAKCRGSKKHGVRATSSCSCIQVGRTPLGSVADAWYGEKT